MSFPFSLEILAAGKCAPLHIIPQGLDGGAGQKFLQLFADFP